MVGPQMATASSVAPAAMPVADPCPAVASAEVAAGDSGDSGQAAAGRGPAQTGSCTSVVPQCLDRFQPCGDHGGKKRCK